MIANGAVAKMVLAVALGGSAGAVSYVTLLHASSDQVPVTITAPSPAGVGTVETPKTADTNLEHATPKRVAKTALETHRHRAKTVAAGSVCTLAAKGHSKTTAAACHFQVAARSRNRVPKVLSYTKAMAVEPLPVQSVKLQHVDKPLPLGSSELFKPVTDAMP